MQIEFDKAKSNYRQNPLVSNTQNNMQKPHSLFKIIFSISELAGFTLLYILAHSPCRGWKYDIYFNWTIAVVPIYILFKPQYYQNFEKKVL